MGGVGWGIEVGLGALRSRDQPPCATPPPAYLVLPFGDDRDFITTPRPRARYVQVLENVVYARAHNSESQMELLKQVCGCMLALTCAHVLERIVSRVFW